MRVKISLKSCEGMLFPFNYNHILTSIIYNLFDDDEFSHTLHDESSYKFFSYSQLIFNDYTVSSDGIVSNDGKISFSISSPSTDLMNHLLAGIVDKWVVYFKGQPLEIVNVKVVPTPDLNDGVVLKTLSPILVRSYRSVDDKLRVVDLAPNSTYFSIVESNLIRKYTVFNGLEDTNKTINVSLASNNVKSKRISIKEKSSNETFNRAYFMRLRMHGDEDLIKFAWDVGLGHKNALGFGMVGV